MSCIPVNDCPLFEGCTTSLKDTSRDDSNNACMVDDTRAVIDFDQAKETYTQALSCTGTPASVDALYSPDDEVLYFIEFKNGNLGGNRQFDLHKKARDSVLMLCDMLDMHISDTRKKLSYIVVYNDERNPSSKSIKTHVGELAKTPIVQFGLEPFRNYLFSNVLTLTVDEFNSFLANIDAQTSSDQLP